MAQVHTAGVDGGPSWVGQRPVRDVQLARAARGPFSDGTPAPAVILRCVAARVHPVRCLGHRAAPTGRGRGPGAGVSTARGQGAGQVRLALVIVLLLLLCDLVGLCCI